MTVNHPTDTALQEFAMGHAPEWASHVAGCPACEAQVALYRNMAGAIREQPAPAFNFNLSAAVLAQLPAPRKKTFPVLYTAIAGILLAAGVAVYFFRTDITALFNGAAAIFTWLVVTTFISILFFQGIDMWRGYRKNLQDILQH